jgi:hypothetical protein
MMSRRFPQLLLLVALALGVAGMHTLGHPHDDGLPGALGHRMVANAQGMAAGPTTMLAALDDGLGTRMGIDPLTVCLAVLVASLLLLLAAMLVADATRGRTKVRLLGVPAGAGRSPPRPSLGLRLAFLSVQRT